MKYVSTWGELEGLGTQRCETLKNVHILDASLNANTYLFNSLLRSDPLCFPPEALHWFRLESKGGREDTERRGVFEGTGSSEEQGLLLRIELDGFITAVLCTFVLYER